VCVCVCDERALGAVRAGEDAEDQRSNGDSCSFAQSGLQWCEYRNSAIPRTPRLLSPNSSLEAVTLIADDSA
jgi:hypothetical protein